MDKTIIVWTNQGYWGKGSSLEEAMKNARLKRGHRYTATLYMAAPEEISVDDMGYVRRPTGAVTVALIDELEGIRF